VSIRQQKPVAPGTLRSWDLDLGAMASSARWAAQDSDLLQREMEQIQSAFPTMVAALGIPLPEGQCWVEAAEPLLCETCHELIVFDRGARCARCGVPATAPVTLIGVVGRIPALISGRPFAQSLDARLARMRQAGDPRAALFASSLLDVGGRRYLAPRIALWIAHSWPHADPPVMVWSEYFPLLDIPPDHVYTAGDYYRLCLFASWREQPAVQVLQNRVVPRLLIDLMVADLQCQGLLHQALEELHLSLYEMYNVVGRPQQSEALQRVYERLIRS